MPPLLSPSLKPADTNRWLAPVTALLLPGENLVAVARMASVFPSADHLAITSSRLLAFRESSVADKGAVVEVAGADVLSVSIDPRFGGRTLLLHSVSPDPRRLGVLQKADCDFVLTHANRIAAASIPAPPTVDVYDPFSMPSSSTHDVRPDVTERPYEPPPPAKQAPSPSDSRDQPAPMRAVGAVEPDRRLVPRWKTVPAYLIAGLFAIITVTAVFDPAAGLAGVLTSGSITLIPLLAVTRARFNAVERRAKAAGIPAEHGTFDRNYLRIGIPLIIVLFLAGVAFA